MSVNPASATKPKEIELVEIRGSWKVRNTERKKFGLPDELPGDCLRHISELAGVRTAIAMRDVSKEWRESTECTLGKAWKDLKKEPPMGPLNLRRAMEKVEVKACKGGTFAHALSRFRLLNDECQKIAGQELVGGKVRLTPEEFAEMQQMIADRDLQACWPEMRNAIIFHNNSAAAIAEGATAEQIRSYLSNPANAAYLGRVLRLHFHGLGLAAVPKEVKYFRNLIHLDLSYNRIQTFSYLSLFQSGPAHEAGVRVTWLDLSNNQIEKWPDLGIMRAVVYLGENAISSFAGLEGVASGCNVIFDVWNIVERRNYDSNSAFFLLFGPQCRFEDNNPLRNAVEFDASGFPIYSRFVIDVINEQSGYEPRSELGKLIHKMCFEAVDDEAIVREILKLSEADKGSIYYGVWKEALARHLNETRGVANIYEGDDLPDGSPTWGEDHAFENMDRLRIALRLAVYRQYESLPMEAQHRIHGRVYGTFSSDDVDGDPLWGAHHYDKNIMLLADLVAQERAASAIEIT